MSSVAKPFIGVLLIAAGAGGLVYVNLQLLPAAVSQQPAASASAPAAISSPAPVDTATASATTTPSAASAPAPSSSPPAASAEPAQGPLAPIKFELTQVTSRNLSKAVEPSATWLKKNPMEKVVLVGHGDPKTRMRDYMEVGRARALTVRRALLDWGVAAARVQVQPAEMEGNQVKGSEQFAGSVEVRVLPKGER
ncbi:MAG: hypothetical protein HY898_26390 [Deltaproteobacteria bacterium]|nr:hypothetical protein [Deltaproteobacteria bacterium]